MFNEILRPISQIPFKGKVTLALNPIHQPLNESKCGHSDLHYISLCSRLDKLSIPKSV
jgi:hypothetical protein